MSMRYCREKLLHPTRTVIRMAVTTAMSPRVRMRFGSPCPIDEGRPAKPPTALVRCHRHPCASETLSARRSAPERCVGVTLVGLLGFLRAVWALLRSSWRVRRSLLPPPASLTTASPEVTVSTISVTREWEVSWAQARRQRAGSLPSQQGLPGARTHRAHRARRVRLMVSLAPPLFLPPRRPDQDEDRLARSKRSALTARGEEEAPPALGTNPQS
jgi:hypothetical protein